MLLVTGATSLVGRHVLLTLGVRRIPHRVLAPPGSRLAAEPCDVLTLVPGDPTDPHVLDRALLGVHTLLLISRAIPNLVAHEQALVRAASQRGVERIVKLSAAGAAPDAVAPLARRHWNAEREVLGGGTEAVVVRAQRPFQHLYTQHQFIGCQGEGRAPDVDARDVAEVLVHLATSAAVPDGAEHPLELTGDRAVTLTEVAITLGRTLEYPVSYVDCPAGAFIQSMTAGGVPTWLASSRAAWQTQVRERGPLFPTRTVARLLGRPPRTLEAFARELADGVRFAGPPPRRPAPAPLPG
jgi:uncharacterized protein YbjT (DUF2867 family)